jgi:hypothetical protein
VRVRLLYFAGCPNVDAARGALCAALRAEGLPVAFEEIDLLDERTPQALREWGSPTVLVDGIDAEGASRGGGGLSCRLYDGGAPTESLFRSALSGRLTP